LRDAFRRWKKIFSGRKKAGEKNDRRPSVAGQAFTHITGVGVLRVITSAKPAVPGRLLGILTDRRAKGLHIRADIGYSLLNIAL